MSNCVSLNISDFQASAFLVMAIALEIFSGEKLVTKVLELIKIPKTGMIVLVLFLILVWIYLVSWLIGCIINHILTACMQLPWILVALL